MRFATRAWVNDLLLSTGCLVFSILLSLDRDAIGHRFVGSPRDLSPLVLASLVLLKHRSAPTSVLAALLLVDWVSRSLDIATIPVMVAAALSSVIASAASRARVTAIAVATFGVFFLSVPFAGRTVSGLFLCVIALCAGTIIGVLLRQFRALARIERDRDHLLTELAGRDALLRVEEDRARLRRELHDVLASSLTVMVRLAEGGAYESATTRRCARQDLLTEIASIGREASSEARAIIAHASANHGDEETIEVIVDRFRSAGLPVSLLIAPEAHDLSPHLMTVANRIIRESLTNCLRHADEPTTVECSLTVCRNVMLLDIADDGRALPASSSGGSGICGIRERVLRCGGRADIGPRPRRDNGRGGWRVHVELPLLITPTDSEHTP